MLKIMKTNKESGKNEMLLERIEAYVEENICKASLDGLAKKLGYSSVYTGSLVKKLTGQPFSKLLQSKRCSVAANKLLYSNMSVDSIIESVGYENESFFRKIFRERYGVNPLEYRKKREG